MRVIVLAECAHLCGYLCGIEAQNVIDHKSICDAVRDMVECAELMSHRVAHTEECVCKRHTCHCCGIRHLLSCDRIVGAVVVRSREILEDHLDRTKTDTVSVIGRHDRSVCLKNVSYRVDTRSSRQSLWRCHVIIRINDRHIREQFVISKRILNARTFICDDCKRSYLRACARRCRYRNEVRLLAHLRECVDPLSDIDKTHRHIEEVCLGVLVKHPHDLSCVHSRTAAERDNNIGLEDLHLLRTLHSACKRRIGSNVGEYGIFYAHLVKFIGDRLCVAVCKEEAVGNNESSLLAHYLKLGKSHGQAAFLEVNLFGCSEPKHIFTPLRYCLYIKKVLYTDVLRNRVSAPRAAAERQRRSELEVVEISDTAERRRSIYNKTASLHSLGELAELFSFVYVVDPENSRMTETAVVV